MKFATWPREHDVMGWKCNNAECGEWRDFADAYEGESHDCALEPYECERCGGTGEVWAGAREKTTCSECHGSGMVPAKGVFTEAWG